MDMDMDMNLDMEMSMDTYWPWTSGMDINARNGHVYGLYESQSLIAIFPRINC